MADESVRKSLLKQNGFELSEMSPKSIKDKQNSHHPYEKANWVSRLFFWWYFPVTFKGFKETLKINDLAKPMNDDESERLTMELQRAYDKYSKKYPQYCLWFAFIRVFWKVNFVNWLIIIVNEALQMVQIVMLNYFLGYFSDDISFKTAMIYASLILLLLFVSFVSNHFYFWKATIISNRIKVAFSGLIYKKLDKLNLSDISKKDALQTIITDSVNKFEDMSLVEVFPYFFIAPAQTVFVVYYIIREVHPYFLIGMSLIIVIVFTILGIAFILDRVRTHLQTAKEDRNGCITEIIEIIKTIKIYCYERFFLKKLDRLRNIELKYQKLVHMITAFNCILDIDLSVAFTFTSVSFLFFFTDVPLKPIYIVFSMAFYTRLCGSFGCFFTKCIVFFIANKISIENIRLFLQSPEHEPVHETNIQDDNTAIHVKNMSVHYATNSDQSSDFKINGFDLDVKKGELFLLTGPSSSGKTTILLSLIGEAKRTVEEHRLNGNYFYVPQKPWIFRGTIIQNIIFKNPYEKAKIKKVLKACCLYREFKDRLYEETSEDGLNLSGGQKARISLARALYSDSDIYLLDDPLSAIDVEYTRKIRQRCIYGYLKNKTRIIATNFTKGWTNYKKIELEPSDLLVNSSSGETSMRVVNASVRNDLIRKDDDLDDLIEDDSDEDLDLTNQNAIATAQDQESEACSNENLEHDETQVMKSLIESPLSKSTDSILSSVYASSEHLRGKRERFDGSRLSKSVYVRFIRAGYGIIGTAMLLVYFLSSQTISIMCDYFVSDWSNYEAIVRERWINNISNQTLNDTSFNVTPSITNSSKEIFGNDSIPITFNLLFHKSVSSNVDFFELRQLFYKEYSILIGIGLFLTFTRPFLFYYMFIVIARNLHKKMAKSVIYTYMKFFNDTSKGEILNRFSNDIKNIDEVIPMTLFDFLQILCFVTATFGLAVYINIFVIVPLIPLLILLFLFRKYYIKTSRALKRLALLYQGPVISLYHMTTFGIASIRAAKLNQAFQIEFYKCMNSLTQINYAYLTLKRWFTLWFDMAIMLFIILVVYGAVLLKEYGNSEHFTPANIGILMTYIYQLATLFQYCIRQSCEVENHMISAERIFEFTNLKPEEDKNGDSKEDEFEDADVPPSWPKKGRIELNNLNFSYSNDYTRPILNSLSMKINGGQKIGIIGRTGSGKTSMFMAMLRMAPLSGWNQICIDRVDVSSIRLGTLRNRITNIPQEPILFTATLRENLDPNNTYADRVEEIYETLKKVGLDNWKTLLEEKIDREKSTLGAQELTNSQKQMICFARALLKKSSIYLIDEATSNMDDETEERMIRLMDTEFVSKTVLIIGHRLKNIVKCDKVLSLKAGGRIEDFDQPGRLIERKNSLLKRYINKSHNPQDLLAMISKK